MYNKHAYVIKRKIFNIIRLWEFLMRYMFLLHIVMMNLSFEFSLKNMDQMAIHDRRNTFFENSA